MHPLPYLPCLKDCPDSRCQKHQPIDQIHRTLRHNLSKHTIFLCFCVFMLHLFSLAGAFPYLPGLNKYYKAKDKVSCSRIRHSDSAIFRSQAQHSTNWATAHLTCKTLHKSVHEIWYLCYVCDAILYTTFSTNYLMMCKVYTDVGGINSNTTLVQLCVR